MFFGRYPFDVDGGIPGAARASKDVDNNRLYEILELSKDCTPADIKKAYRKLAMKYHPDKGGDQEKFKDISFAYEILIDPEKKRLYDTHGEAALSNAGTAPTDPTDIFDLFFGGGRRSAGANRQKKGEDLITKIKVTLEQAYNGATRKWAINRDVICLECDGVGGAEKALETCSACNGHGYRVQVRHIGPMIQQTQGPCTSCNGQGRFIPEKSRCKTCKGEGTVKERKILEVNIDKGIGHGQKIVFAGEADQRPGELPGDVIFVIDFEEHQKFARSGSDLYYKQTISLYEALLGYEVKITHLDKRELIIKSTPGQITRPGEIRAVAGEGMPKHKNPFIKGSLLIIFDVKFPLESELTDARRTALMNGLIKPQPIQYNPNDPNVEIHFAEVVDPAEVQRRQERERENERDEDEGQHHGGGSMQCKQQ